MLKHTDGNGRDSPTSAWPYTIQCTVQTQIIIICEAKIPVYTAMYRVKRRGCLSVWCVFDFTVREQFVLTFWKLDLHWIIFEDTACSPQYTHSISVMKNSHFMLYMEIITVCSETHTKHIHAHCGQIRKVSNVKPCGKCCNDWALKGLK
jgi:hypothetical protein